MVLFLWLLFKNENYERLSQDSLLLLNKKQLVAVMSLTWAPTTQSGSVNDAIILQPARALLLNNAALH